MAVKRPAKTSRTVETETLDLVTSPPAGDGGEGGEGLGEIAARVREREAALTPARRALQERHEKELLDGAAEVTVETALRGAADIKIGIDAALDKVAESVVAEAKRLAQLREAAQVLQRRISEMHDIEVVANSLATLVRDHGVRTAEFEANAAASRRDLEESLAARKADFEREAVETRFAWEKEKRAWREAFDLEKAAAKREWEREREEHEYTVRTRQTREEAEHEAAQAAQETALAEVEARHEKAMTEREAAVAARERETNELRDRVAAFQAELDRAVLKAREEAVASSTERARHEAELRAREVDGETRLLKLRIQTLENTVKEQAIRIGELQAEQKESTERVRDIAVKAIEGASGATALSRVNEIAMQQARARTEPKA